MKTDSKSEKVNSVATSILRLLDQKGLKDITHSNVSKVAKVSRSWLYKYIGKNKSDLIDFAIINFGKQFTNLDRPYRGKNPASFKKAVLLGNIEMFENALKMPHLISLYYKYNRSENELGKAIRQIETQYLKKMVNKIIQIYKADQVTAKYVADIMTSMRMSIALQMIRYSEKERPNPRQMQKYLSKVISVL